MVGVTGIFERISFLLQKSLFVFHGHRFSFCGIYFFAQLLGMSDNISFNLAHEGYNVTKYVPYAKVRDVLPYLIRRAEENTSVAGQTSRELRMLKAELDRRKAVRAF